MDLIKSFKDRKIIRARNITLTEEIAQTFQFAAREKHRCCREVARSKGHDELRETACLSFVCELCKRLLSLVFGTLRFSRLIALKRFWGNSCITSCEGNDVDLPCIYLIL